MENYLLELRVIGIDKDGDEHEEENVYLHEDASPVSVLKLFEQVIKFVGIISE